MLCLLDPTRHLFLAVSDVVYAALVNMEMFLLVAADYQIALLVVALDTEEVVQWKP